MRAGKWKPGLVNGDAIMSPPGSGRGYARNPNAIGYPTVGITHPAEIDCCPS